MKYVRDPMFDGCDFDILLTPVNLKLTGALPGTYIDASGTEYNSLPEDISESIRLTKKGAELPADLTILSISDDYYGVNGTKASFHIEAEGRGTIAYQWQYKLAGESVWRIPGQASAKSADYTFKLKRSYDNIEVRCIVTDAAGNTCTSDVRKANVFAITKQPELVFSELGERVTFSVEGIGQNLTYQWYYRQLEGGWKKVTDAGADTASLTITAKVENNVAQYRCYVYDGVGNLIKSQAAMLIEENEEYEG